MAKTYQRGFAARLVNSWFKALTRLGLGAEYRHVLSVRGRRSGRIYSTPVDVIEVNGSRWLVAGYGPASWVDNARASREVTLSRGGVTETFAVAEPGRDEAIPVLRAYIAEIRVTRPYFDATAESPDDIVAAELTSHPVFRLVTR